jgi:hypothetical protein
MKWTTEKPSEVGLYAQTHEGKCGSSAFGTPAMDSRHTACSL